MKGNQGLEALAALCGGQSDVAMEGESQGSQGAPPAGGNNGGAPQRHQGSQDSSLQAPQRQVPVPNQQNPLSALSAQQWQQAIAAASALQNSGATSSLAHSLLLSGLSSQGLGDNSYPNMQQYAIQRYMQAQAKLSAAQQAAVTQSLGNFGDASHHQALMMALAAGKAQQLQQALGYEPPKQAQHQSQQMVIPSATGGAPTPSVVNHPVVSHETQLPLPAASSAAAITSPGVKSMQPPPPPSVQALPSTLSTNLLSHTAPIAPMPGAKVVQDPHDMDYESSDDKKQQKRAANRKSAQLSRKRKKQFIEELKEENDDLRRKEQILRSIPDLIVVFDSSGKLAFVSESVSRFLNMGPDELEGTSFWDRLCEDSVRLLKAAFMDSLAARKPDSETAPLGSGVWELRLRDKDSNFMVVTLNGVVHFTGDAPECVCCIRPRDQKEIKELPMERKAKSAKPHSRFVSSSDGSRTSDDSGNSHPRIRVNPNQSVISNDISTEDNSAEDESSPQESSGSNRKKIRRSKNDSGEKRGIRVSDGDSGCEVSESSGSDDGIASS